MGIDGILRYTLRAGRFGLIVGAVWIAVRLAWKRGRVDVRREAALALFVVYAAMLTEIIALRGGTSGQRGLQLIPMKTTLGELRSGAWPFVYHVVGNMIWFVPMGLLLPRLWRTGAWQTVLIGAGASLALEICQWILKTGITDADDLLLNALGAAAGYLIHIILKHWRGGR